MCYRKYNRFLNHIFLLFRNLIQHSISHIILSIVILDFRHSSLWPSPWLLPTPTMAMAATVDTVATVLESAVATSGERPRGIMCISSEV